MHIFVKIILLFCINVCIVLGNHPPALAAPYTLPPLPYDYNALEPYIDAQTMQIHHDKHHAAYVDNLNKALEKYPKLQGQPIEKLLQNLNQLPNNIRTVVLNNGGGHYNHTLFWQIMGPQKGGQPTGALADAINRKFGSFVKFQDAFEVAGTKRFGSGWVWLIKTSAGGVDVVSTPNQEPPFGKGNIPIMGNDVWEHAYYLKYQNRRPEYLKAWWNVVNWDEVSKRFSAR
jgi:superoxide dismutase, Fe-Mn family